MYIVVIENTKTGVLANVPMDGNYGPVEQFMWEDGSHADDNLRRELFNKALKARGESGSPHNVDPLGTIYKVVQVWFKGAVIETNE